MRRSLIWMYIALSILLIYNRPLLAETVSSNPNTANNPNTVATQATNLEVRLTGTDLYNALVKDVTHEVEKSIESRNSENITWIGIGLSLVVAIVGFWGVRSFSDLRTKVTEDVKEHFRNADLVRRVVEESIQAHITSDIDKRLNVVAKELAFYRLSNLASNLRAGTGFSNTERDAALASLEELRTETNIIKRKEFADVLEKIIDAFSAADLDCHIDTIEENLSDVIGETPGIVQTLIHHYGMRVLGDVEEDNDTVVRFCKYVEACKRLRFNEWALPHKMVLEYRNKKDGWEARINGLLQDAEHLTDSEREFFRKTLLRNSDINEICKVPTGKTIRFAQAFQEFLAVYGDRIGICPVSSDKIAT